MNAPLAAAIVSALCVSLDRRAFANTLSRLKHVVPRKSPTPIGEALLLASINRGLALTVMDRELVVRATLNADVSWPGELVLSTSALCDVVRRASGRVTLDGATVSVGPVVHELTALDRAAFSAISTPSGETLSEFHRASLARLLNATRYAISTDATRPHLASLKFERVNDTLTVVATDGHRLVAASISDAGAPYELLVGRRAVDELARWIDEPGGPVTLQRDGERFFFVSGDAWVSALAVDAEYPSWRQVVPRESTGTMTVPKTVFTDAVKAVVGRDGRGVRLTPEPDRRRVRVEHTDAEGKAAVTHVDALFRGTVPPAIGFDAKFLTEMISALPGVELTVALELSGELDPVKVQTHSGVVAVAMPMRL